MEKREDLANNSKIKKPTRWDKKWRLVLFDACGSHKKKYKIIYQELDNLGFVMISDGVYIHPYECLEAIKLLVKIYKMEACLKYKLVVSIKEAEKVIIGLNNKITP